MKKVVEIIVTLCALAAGVGFLLFGAPSFVKSMQGAKPLEAGQTFAGAEGEYISYEAAYPVASWVAEYYSGDPDRARKMGYVVYDAEQEAFLTVIIPVDYKGALSQLMDNLKLRAKLRAEENMEPVLVDGTPKRIEGEALEAPLFALENSRIRELYDTYGGVDGNKNRSDYAEHFGDCDEYGRVLEDLCIALDEGRETEMEWYSVEDGCVNGFTRGQLFLIMLTAVLSLLIFVFRLRSMLKSGKAEPYKTSASGGRLGQVVNAQWSWVAGWCDYSMNRGRRLAYLSAAGGAVILTVIGVLAKMSVRGIFSFHLPLGLFLGELTALLFWFSQKKRSNPDKILVNIAKNLEKQLPSPAEQDAFVEDFMNTGSGEWVFREPCKDTMLYGVVGERYWSAFSGLGIVTVVDSEKLQRIETEEISGTVNVNGVRTRYRSFAANFFYQSDEPKKKSDKAISFETSNGIGQFMTLVRRRTNNSIEVISK